MGGALIMTIVVMFSGIGEHFSAGDLTRIRDAEAHLRSACRPPISVARADRALATLTRFFDRSPRQPLPLHGAGLATNMRDDLTLISRSLPAGGCTSNASIKAMLARVTDPA